MHTPTAEMRASSDNRLSHWRVRAIFTMTTDPEATSDTALAGLQNKSGIVL